MDGEKLYGLDLFSGIGGITLALEQYVTPVAYCEKDRYAQSVLLSRMSEGKLPTAPIWDDITTLRGENLPIKPDIIYGGFPCQDLSTSKTNKYAKGLEGEQSGLFYELFRLVKEVKPYFVFLENVPAIKNRGLEKVIFSFSDLRYDCRWTSLSASNLKTKISHQRDRWFFMAYSEDNWTNRGSREQRTYEETCGEETHIKTRCCEHDRIEEFGTYQKHVEDMAGQKLQTDTMALTYGETPSDVLRVVNGVFLPNRMDRIKCLGNSVVPVQALEAFEKLMGLKRVCS